MAEKLSQLFRGKNMRTLIAMVLVCIFQFIVIDPATRMPAYVDPDYMIDGRALIPESRQSDIILYNTQVSQGQSQEAWLIRPQGDGTAAAIPLTSDDND